jgi:hypothetical protein
MTTGQAFLFRQRIDCRIYQLLGSVLDLLGSAFCLVALTSSETVSVLSKHVLPGRMRRDQLLQSKEGHRAHRVEAIHALSGFHVEFVPFYR